VDVIAGGCWFTPAEPGVLQKTSSARLGGGGGVCGHELAKQGDLCNGPSGSFTNSQIPTTPNPYL